MPFVEKTRGNAIDIKKQKDLPHTGTYVGNKSITTKIGPQTIYEFEDEAGEKFGIYGFTNLNREMADIKDGEVLRITYLGTRNVVTKFGPKDVHQVRVEIFQKDPEKVDDTPF